MNKNTAKNTTSKAKSRKTPQELFSRTPQQLKDQYDNRSFASKLRRAKMRVSGLPWFVSHGKVEENYLSHFVTHRKLKGSLLKDSIYINIYTRGIASQESKTIKGNIEVNFSPSDLFGLRSVTKQTHSCKTCQRKLNFHANNYIRERYKYCWDCMTGAERGCYSRDIRAYRKRMLEDRAWHRQEKVRRQQYYEAGMVSSILVPQAKEAQPEVIIAPEFLQFFVGKA